MARPCAAGNAGRHGRSSNHRPSFRGVVENPAPLSRLVCEASYPLVARAPLSRATSRNEAMMDWPDILGQIVHGPELWQLSAEPDSVGLADVLSVAFFAAVLTCIGVAPSVPRWIRRRQRPDRARMLRQERRVARWWRHYHGGRTWGPGHDVPWRNAAVRRNQSTHRPRM